MEQHTVIVVGADPAGLAAAARLQRAGLRAVVLERADAVGASWRGRYDRLRLNSAALVLDAPRRRRRSPRHRTSSRRATTSSPTSTPTPTHHDARHPPRRRRSSASTATATRWVVRTSAGELRAQPRRRRRRATTTARTSPRGRAATRFGGQLAARRRATARRRRTAAGTCSSSAPGCTGAEIAYDLVEGGARARAPGGAHAAEHHASARPIGAPLAALFAPADARRRRASCASCAGARSAT